MITIVSAIITTILSFVVGMINLKTSVKNKYKEFQLDNVFTPIIREIETFDINNNSMENVIDNIFKIVYENYQYVPDNFLKQIINLKHKNDIYSSLEIDLYDELNKIKRIATNEYVYLQSIFRKNDSSTNSFSKKINFIDKLITILTLVISPSLLIIAFVFLFLIDINSFFGTLFSIIAFFCSLVGTVLLNVKDNISKKEIDTLL